MDEYVAEQRERLVEDESWLEGVRAGSRRGPGKGWLGWDTSEKALVARTQGRRAWIEKLLKPDRWLAAFLERTRELDEHARRMAIRSREEAFLRRHFGEPTWERDRPYRTRRNEKAKARGELLRAHATGKIDRAAIYDRDGGVCFFCGNHVPRADFDLHHVVPPPRGPHGPENLRIAHPLCHSAAHSGHGTVSNP